MSHPLLEKHPSGSFPVSDVAKSIGQEVANVRRKASAMNGQVNFDATEDTLNAEQLKALLPSYLSGQRQLKGAKRKSVESLLKALDLPLDLPFQPVVKKPSKPIQKEVEAVETPPVENQLKRSFLTNQNFLLAVVLGLVLVQASHFSLYYIQRVGNAGFIDWLTVVYAVLIGVLAEAMGLILVANGRGKKWLAIFAVVSYAINCLFYKVYQETGFDLWGEMLLAAILPAGIYLSSELYIETK